MSDLPETERARIRLEETYREEVRRELSATLAGSRKSRLLSFLNSSFGLWVLSAIFISGLGTVYRCYEDDAREEELRLSKKLDEEREKRSLAIRLDREISYRFSRILEDLDQIALPGRLAESTKAGRDLADSSIDHLRQAETVIETSFAAPKALTDTLYPENANKALPVLLLELADLVEDPNDRDQVMSAHSELRKMAGRPVQVMRVGAPHAREHAAWLNEKCLLPRWRRHGFRYTNCPAKTPFCNF